MKPLSLQTGDSSQRTNVNFCKECGQKVEAAMPFCTGCGAGLAMLLPPPGAPSVEIHGRPQAQSTSIQVAPPPQPSKSVTFLEILKYLATVIVALSVPALGLVAFSILAFCDHGPVIKCFLIAAAPVGVALSQVVSLVKARALLTQRRRLRLAAGLMILSIAPAPVAILLYKLI